MKILNYNLQDNKPIFISLQDIFGIGLKRSLFILQKLKIYKFLLTNELLTPKYYAKFILLRNYLKTIKKILGNELQRKIYYNVKDKIDSKSRAGIRLSKKLPVRGQRTHSNNKTNKKLRK